MLNITLLTVGKLKEDHWRAAAAEYQKRLGAFCRLNIIEIEESRLPGSPSPALISAALEDEGGRILAKLPPGAFACSLCVEGERLASEELAKKINGLMTAGQSHIVFIIGSSHGLSPRVKERSDLKLSMSAMTFPHQLARVMLLEQLYRAFQILGDGKYHK